MSLIGRVLDGMEQRIALQVVELDVRNASLVVDELLDVHRNAERMTRQLRLRRAVHADVRVAVDRTESDFAHADRVQLRTDLGERLDELAIDAPLLAAVPRGVLDAADLHARHVDRIDDLALRRRALPRESAAIELLLARHAR